MNKYHVRRAVPADAPRIISGINAVCAEHGYFYTSRYVPTPEWEAVLRDPESVPDHLVLVAELDNIVVGVARLFPCSGCSEDARTGELGLFVIDRLRGCGVGTALMQELLHRAPVLGYTRITLSVRRANEQAIRFYRKFGFEVEGLQWQEYASLGLQEELRMARPLEPGGFGGKPMASLSPVRQGAEPDSTKSLELPLFAPDSASTLSAAVVVLDQSQNRPPSSPGESRRVDADCACE